MPHAATPPPEVPQYVNDGLLPAEQVGTLKPSYPNEPLEELRERYKKDGYLFVKGLIPREDVIKCRKHYFELLSPSGVLAPGSAPEDGIFDAAKNKKDYPGIGAGAADANGRPEGGLFVDLALQAHTEPWYKEDFCHHPALMEFIANFSGWEENTLALTRTLLRNNTPGNKAIGVHYDQIFLRYGADTSITAWVPIGDISLQGGGLIYLENSHTLGDEMENEFFERAKKTGLTDEEARSGFNKNMMHGGMLSDSPKEFGAAHGRRWLVTDYEAGDVVLHLPYTIHSSTINHDPKQVIRLGTDLRFVDSSQPYDKRWTNDYMFGDGV